MTSAVVALIANCLLAGTTPAEAVAPAKSVVVSFPSPLKRVGAPDIVPGTIALSQVFYRARLTYARTGVLSASLDLAGKDGRFTLPVGTRLFGIMSATAYWAPLMWCTMPQAKLPEICLLHRSGGPIWSLQTRDIPFSGVVIVPQPVQPAPEPQVEETPGAPAAVFTIEYSLADPDEGRGPAVLADAQNYDVSPSPKPVMVIKNRITDGDVEMINGGEMFFDRGDAIIDGARVSYDPVTRTGTVARSLGK